LQLFAERLSCEDLRANQLRLLFSTIADTLLAAVRAFGLPATELAQAESATIRQKLLKLGARITVSCRRIVLSLSEASPYQALFTRVWEQLRRLAAPDAAAWSPLGSSPPTAASPCRPPRPRLQRGEKCGQVLPVPAYLLCAAREPKRIKATSVP
jgi:hypothetical protein